MAFSRTEIAEILLINVHTFDHWKELGVLDPVFVRDGKGGHGHTKYYTLDDVRMWIIKIGKYEGFLNRCVEERKTWDV